MGTDGLMECAPTWRLTVDKESSGSEERFESVTAYRPASSRFDAWSTRQGLFYPHKEDLAMTIGIDVSKDELVCSYRDGQPFSHPNSAKGVKRFLSRLAPATTIAMEATGRYHRLLADTAYSMGFMVIVLNPKDVSRYAKSVSPRASTDPLMAQIISEFASIRERRAYATPPAFVDALKNLVRTRAGLVKHKTALNNQASQHPDIAEGLRAAIASINLSINKLNQDIVKVARSLPEYQLLFKIKGFGELTAAYMTAMLASGVFRTSDAFVAFIGYDLRVRESGKLKGKRKLSKRGDPEARHLLYMAALAAAHKPGPFADLYTHYMARGFTKTETLVFIARKLARVAWAIYTKKQPYNPDRVLNQPGSPSHPTDGGTRTMPSPSYAVRSSTLSRFYSTPETEPTEFILSARENTT
jgi:transposase